MSDGMTNLADSELAGLFHVYWYKINTELHNNNNTIPVTVTRHQQQQQEKKCVRKKYVALA